MKSRIGAGLTLVIAGVLLGAAAAQKSPVQKPMKEFLNPPGLSKPTGFTQVVTAQPGRMVFISGQGGSAGGQMPEDFASQAKNTFENIGRALAAAGAGFNDVVKINYYLTDLSNTTELRRIRAQYLNQAAPPAATLVQAGLGKGLLLEVEAIAIVHEVPPPGDRYGRRDKMKD